MTRNPNGCAGKGSDMFGKIASDCDGRYVPHRCQYCQFWPICSKQGRLTWAR